MSSQVSAVKEMKNDVSNLEDENAQLKQQIAVRDALSLDVRRTLHWVIKIGNLKKSMQFFQDVLQMKVIRHEEFDAGCDAKCNGDYARPWSKTMITQKNAVDGEKSNFALELTYNYGIKGYERGNDLRYIGVLITSEALENAQKLGYECTKIDDMFYEIVGPDNLKYRCKITAQKEWEASKEIFWSVALNVTDIETSFAFWCGALNMQPLQYNADKGYLRVCYGSHVPLEFYQLKAADTALNHACAQGRIAISTRVARGVYHMNDYIVSLKKEKYKVHTKPITLATPGKADVDVVILQDPDDYEICFVNEDGFDDLCTTKDGDDIVDWKARAEKGADADKGKFEKLKQ